MTLNTIVNMVLRRLLRRAVNAGVNASINAVAERGKRDKPVARDDTPQDAPSRIPSVKPRRRSR